MQLDEKLGGLNNQALETRWAANPDASNNLVWYVHYQTRPVLDFYLGVQGMISQNLIANPGANYRHAGQWYLAVQLFLYERLTNPSLTPPEISHEGAVPDPRIVELETNYLRDTLAAQDRLLLGYHDFNPTEPRFMRPWTPGWNPGELGTFSLDESRRVISQTGIKGFSALLHAAFFDARWF